MILQCPHCGSEKGYYTLNDYRNVPVYYSFDNAVVKADFEVSNATHIRKNAYCIQCGHVISTLNELKKKQKRDIQKNPIAVYRKKKGLTQEKLAAYLGCSRGAVALWESQGAKPKKYDHIRKMGELFGKTFMKKLDAYYRK